MHESLKSHPNEFDLYEIHVKQTHPDEWGVKMPLNGWIMTCSHCDVRFDLDPTGEKERMSKLTKHLGKIMGEEYARRRDKQLLELFNE